MMDLPNSKEIKSNGTFQGCKQMGSYPTVRAISYRYRGIDYTIFEVEDRDVVYDEKNPYNVEFGGF